MKKIAFTKMVATGNDFVVIESGYKSTGAQEHKLLAQNMCDRKYGIGADGLLVLERSKVADIKMRIFNADGSEAEMCGNGARCAALYSNSRLRVPNPGLTLETKAGIIESVVRGDSVKIKLTDPKDIKINFPIKVNNRALNVNFINTGVPHTVIFVEGLDKIDVANLGRQIRFHKKFTPVGTNVDFVEVMNNNSISVRTYERGVEDETLACGTGSVASAIISNYKFQITNYRMISVLTKSGEILKVHFERVDDKFKNVWLEGRAKIVYTGEYNV